MSKPLKNPKTTSAIRHATVLMCWSRKLGVELYDAIANLITPYCETVLTWKKDESFDFFKITKHIIVK